MDLRPSTHPSPFLHISETSDRSAHHKLPPQAPFRFLDLPLELRTKIYELAFIDEQFNHNGTWIPTRHVYAPALSHVNSEIREEALAVFFSRATFYINIGDQQSWSVSHGTTDWLSSTAISPHIAQLRSLEFSLFSGYGERTNIGAQMAADGTVSIKCDRHIPIKWWVERRPEPRMEAADGGDERNTLTLPGELCVKKCNKLKQIRLVQEILRKALGAGSKPAPDYGSSRRCGTYAARGRF